jgi:hypothetical protein
MSLGYFQLGYFNPALVRAASGTTFLIALRTYLKGAPALADLTDVYLNRTPAKPAFPFLVVSQINTGIALNTGSGYEATPELQFTVVTNDDVQAVQLGEAAFDALKPNGANPKLIWDDGNETTRDPLFDGRLMPQRGQGVGNLSVWAYTFGFRWFIVRSRS